MKVISQNFIQQESDTLVTLSVIETAISHLEAKYQEPLLDTRNTESHNSCKRKSDQLNGEQILNTENRTPKLHSDNEADQSKDTQQDPQQQEPTHVNGHSEGGDEVDEWMHIERMCRIAENVLREQVQHAEFHDNKGTGDYLELQSGPGNEQQENISQPENENLICQKDLETENMQPRNHLDDGVQETTTDTTKNKHKLHNGQNLSSENTGLWNREELDIRNTQPIEKITTPEPKPRTVRPNM